MQLSKNFWLSEFTKSQTAARHGIDNTPNRRVIGRLKLLVENVLQPVRDEFGPVTINSGYRSPELNNKIGSSSKSQHIRGEAADIELAGISNYELAKWIEDNLEYDQLILEMYDPDDGPNSGWVHVSYVENRQESLTFYKSGNFANGLRKT